MPAPQQSSTTLEPGSATLLVPKHRVHCSYVSHDSYRLLLHTPMADEPTHEHARCLRHVERQWIEFIQIGPSAMAWDASGIAAYLDGFRMLEGETLAGLLAEYERVAARTDELVRTLPDLDAAQPLPEAPWFEPGARWSARRVLLHLIAETAQHSGHTDIIRESLDGAKSMA